MVFMAIILLVGDSTNMSNISASAATADLAKSKNRFQNQPPKSPVEPSARGTIVLDYPLFSSQLLGCLKISAIR